MVEGFKSIGQVISDDSSFDKLRSVVKDSYATAVFNEIFSKSAGFIEAVSCDNGVLTVKVDSSVFKTELKVKQSEIINEINKKLSDDIVKSLKVI